MMSSALKRLASQSGAAVIEALGTMVVFIAALLLALLVGVTFYNTNVLNSAAQNITLNTQVLTDRFCSPGQTDSQGSGCASGQLAARGIAGEVVANLNTSQSGVSRLLYVEPGSVLPISVVAPPSTSAVTWPAAEGFAGGATLPKGWGYNSVVLTANQQLVGGPGALVGPMTLKAKSIAVSYKDPSR